jgi:hypothetical protein
MPRLEDIEQFKTSLKSIGKETEALARWGETWQDLAAPPKSESDEPSLQLEDTAVDSAGDQGGTAEDMPDFQSFLDTLPSDDLPEESQADEPVSTTDDFELPASFGDESLDALNPDTIPDTPDAAEVPEIPAEPDDYSVPDSLLADFEELTEPEPETKLEPEPELEPETGLEAGASEGAAAESFGLDDLSALDTTATGETVSFDDFPMDTPAGMGPAEALPEEPLELGNPDEVSRFDTPEEAIPEIEDFAIPEDISSETPEAEAREAEAFNLGSELPEGDAFDHFNLGDSTSEMPSFDASIPEIGADDFSKGLGTDDLDGQLANLDSELPATDNFSLDSGWEGDFSIPGFEMGNETKPAPGAKPSAGAPAKAADDVFSRVSSKPRPAKQARAVELTEQQVDALQDTLLSYPLNLRLAIEDIIANSRGTEVQQSELVWMLVEGAKARDAAKLAGQVLKKYIEIPAGFEKRTGAAFEAEKGSLRYIFIHSILPILQVMALVLAGAGALFYLGYNFVYKPLKANSLYAQGYRQISLDKYTEAVEYFDQADQKWTMKSWHFRYAEAFAERKQIARSEEMYERLLGRWPKDTKAALEYAGMESRNRSYEKVESVLKRFILERDYFNKDALRLSAANYLDWAESDEQRYEGVDQKFVASLYENARLQLATLMERHGRSDEYLELMLVYFIRSEHLKNEDKLREILPLASYFIDNSKSTWSAGTLAELADYLMYRKETEDVNNILLRATDADGSMPEVHVAMARWNRMSGFPKEELKALAYADRFYTETDLREGLSIKRLKRYIASLVRYGELLKDAGRPLDAEDALNNAVERYEKALRSKQLHRSAQYGKMYALLADIYFFERQDFSGALLKYANAESNEYITPATDYRRGYIHYLSSGKEGSEALKFFYRAGLDTEATPYLIWATANALYTREDYFAAQGYYTMLAERLQFELDTLPLPSPQARPSHGEIVELLMMTRNNLGVSLYRIAERMGDVRRRAEAMVELTESARLFDSLSRDQTTMIRSDSKNLGFLNLDFILHPMRGIDLAVYKQLPPSMDYPRK